MSRTPDYNKSKLYSQCIFEYESRILHQTSHIIAGTGQP